MNYASFTSNDKIRYVSFLAGKNSKNVTLVTTKPLKSPSSKEAGEIFFTMLKNNKELLEEYNKAPITRMTPTGLIDDKKINQILNSESTNKYYYRIANSQFQSYKDLPNVKKQFTKELKNRGYNMLLDENDIGGGISKNPIILLDGENTVKIKSEDFIDKRMKKKANIDRKDIKRAEKWLKENGFNVSVE